MIFVIVAVEHKRLPLDGLIFEKIIGFLPGKLLHILGIGNSRWSVKPGSA